MPFVEDGNLYTIITQALEERYGQNGRKGLSRAEFRVSLADRAIFQAFWKIDLAAGTVVKPTSTRLVFGTDPGKKEKKGHSDLGANCSDPRSEASPDAAPFGIWGCWLLVFPKNERTRKKIGA
jgi:hypothetical protein